MEQPMCVDHSNQSNLIMEQIPTYPKGRSVVNTQRDKYRERFDVPDHPLWEEVNVARLPERRSAAAHGTLHIFRLGRGYAASCSSSPALQLTDMSDGDSPSLGELMECYNSMSPVASDDDPDDDPLLSPESVMDDHGSSLFLASDTSFMVECDTLTSPLSPVWSNSS